MRRPIPGLDASFIEGMDGVFYWAINPEWNPLKTRDMRRNGKRKDRPWNQAEEQISQGSIWNDLAEW